MPCPDLGGHMGVEVSRVHMSENNRRRCLSRVVAATGVMAVAGRVMSTALCHGHFCHAGYQQAVVMIHMSGPWRVRAFTVRAHVSWTCAHGM